MSRLSRKLLTHASPVALVALMSLTACGGGGGDSGNASPAPVTPGTPSAASCASARSGDYRLINPNATTAATQFRKASFDAATLTLRFADGSTTSATATPGKPCQFTSDGGASTVIVGETGLMIERYMDGASPRLLIGLPEQVVAASELTGDWNTMQFLRASPTTSLVNANSTFTVNAVGAMTAAADCPQTLACVAGAVAGSFTANPDGGLNFGTDRFFAHRTPAGGMVLVGLIDAGLVVAARQSALTLPAVGTGASYWDVSVNGAGTASALLDDTTSSLTASGSTYTRSRSSDGRIDTFSINTPRTGMRYRAANTCLNASGAPAPCTGILVLPLPGTGVSVYGSSVVGNDFLGVSVNKP